MKTDSKAVLAKESKKNEEEKNKLQDTSFIQDAFIFCPMLVSIVINDTMVQGIFASEREMNQTECTKHSFLFNFTTIAFEEKDTKMSKIQAIEEYLMDVKDNAREYGSALYVEGILCYENDVPVENWLFNSVENLKGTTINLPLNWMDVSQLIHSDKWPLLYSLSIERVEKERLNISVAVFGFWEQ